MSKFRFELNPRGVRALLKSPEVASVCMREASKRAQSCGDGYVVQSRTYKERSGAAIYAESYKAVRDNLKNNTLLRSVGQ